MDTEQYVYIERQVYPHTQRHTHGSSHFPA